MYRASRGRGRHSFLGAEDPNYLAASIKSLFRSSLTDRNRSDLHPSTRKLAQKLYGFAVKVLRVGMKFLDPSACFPCWPSRSRTDGAIGVGSIGRLAGNMFKDFPMLTFDPGTAGAMLPAGSLLSGRTCFRMAPPMARMAAAGSAMLPASAIPITFSIG